MTVQHPLTPLTREHHRLAAKFPPCCSSPPKVEDASLATAVPSVKSTFIGGEKASCLSRDFIQRLEGSKVPPQLPPQTCLDLRARLYNSFEFFHRH